MRIDIFTIFPAIFESPLRESLLGRAVATGILDIRIHDIRDQTDDPHHQVDDEPFGGGPGMVMMADRALSRRAPARPAARSRARYGGVAGARMRAVRGDR